MVCPNCNVKLPSEWQFPRCPYCGIVLSTENATEKAEPANVSIGDANAISGDVHIETHNVTNMMERQKTDDETLQEKIAQYKQLCERVYADGRVDLDEARLMESLRLTLGLDSKTANDIQHQVREMRFHQTFNRLNPIAKIGIKQVVALAKAGNTEKLLQNLPRLETLAKKYNVDDVQFYYYLILSAVEPQKCIDTYNKRQSDNYWLSFWTCLAFLNSEQSYKTEAIMSEMEVFDNYPYGNITLLAATSCLYQYWGDTSIEDYKEQANDLFEVGVAEHSDLLDRFSQALMLLLEPSDGYINDFENEFSFYFKYIFYKIMEKKKQAYLRRLIPPIPKIAPLPH